MAIEGYKDARRIAPAPGYQASRARGSYLSSSIWIAAMEQRADERIGRVESQRKWRSGREHHHITMLMLMLVGDDWNVGLQGDKVRQKGEVLHWAQLLAAVLEGGV